MFIFDALDKFLDLLNLFNDWRFYLAAAIGVGAGFALYYMSGETPASKAVAFAFGFTGVCTGLIWQFRHERHRGVFSEWRFFLTAAIGVGAGLVLYYMSGGTPAYAAMAFALGLTGVCVGLLWQLHHERRR